MTRTALTALLLAATFAPIAAAQTAAPAISNIRYDLTFTRSTAAAREVEVAMTFEVQGDGPVLLSLPAWTPGSYGLEFFARRVLGFDASAGDRALAWDKVDFDTWRVDPAGTETVTVDFAYRADTLDNGIAWSAEDFLMVNGTNVFLYPEGADLGFGATVTVQTEPDWQVATGMTYAGTPRTFVAADYHELVDMPMFVGALDVDSTIIDGHWYHLASYPRGAMEGDGRAVWWEQMEQMVPAMTAVYGDTPWDSYTTLFIFDDEFPGGAALEHANSHIGIYHPAFIGNPMLASITAHEIVHAWNVKRLRPAAMVPYDYSQAQPTPLLWVSEGITDYYADLTLVRAGVVPPFLFYRLTAGKINEVANAGAVALEDASLNTWIDPIEVDHYIYYPKGSLVGFLIDILMRDASDNAAGLDDVMRALYERTYLTGGGGFTTEQFWSIASELAGGYDFSEFHARYVDGRDPLPWATTLPLAGMEFRADTTRVARIGISTTVDSSGVRVVDVVDGGMAAKAGVHVGDHLVQVGELLITGNDFGIRFRNRYANTLPGTPLALVVNRDGETVSLDAALQFQEIMSFDVVEDRRASAKARRIREGLLTGTTGN
jgi:predicted metalloprotease with PDZ domain